MAASRRSPRFPILLRALSIALLAGPALSEPVAAQVEPKLSRFGEYRGYSSPSYDGWSRTSQYLTARDGTRLAIDLYRPSRGGAVETAGLPVIWTHTPYYRATIVKDRLATVLDYLPWVATVLRYGYVVAAVDVRGTGASFGAMDGLFQPAEARDAYDVTEWLAAQPWSNGKVGMFGLSYLGITQLLAAGQAPPHLKAIIPEMAWFDAYDFIYPGGILQFWSLFAWSASTRTSSIRMVLPPKWGDVVREGSRSRPGRWPVEGCVEVPCAPMGRGPVAPVDDDANASLLAAAVSQHLRFGSEVYPIYASLPFRNSRRSPGIPDEYGDRSIGPVARAIADAGIAVYTVAGWYDIFTRDATLVYRNLGPRRRLTIGPWFHNQMHGYDKSMEVLRWFDYWLKGIDNGIESEAPIHYWTIDAPAGQEWRSAKEWPLPEARPRAWFLAPGRSGSIQSINDGRLSAVDSAGREERDDYPVDYFVTLGPSNRWTAASGGAPGPVHDYPDLADHDRRSLTYSTAPLPAAIEVTGHPLVHLWVSSDAKDADVFAVLEEVGPDGYSDYVTEGWLRASHRALAEPPYDRLGLPFHPSRAEDVAPLPDGPVELVFDLLPTSKVFRAGYRIRLTISGTDNGNFATPVTVPSPRMSIHRGEARRSRLTLPVVERAPGRP